jgi:hypothetical protein
MDFLTPEIIAYFITAIIGVVGSVFGTKYAAIKKVFKVIIDAAEDERITPEEVQKIILAIKSLKL